MDILRKLDHALAEHAKRIFWCEPSFQKSFAEFAADVAAFRQDKRSGIWLSYDQTPYQQAVSAIAAMYDGWVLAILSRRYTWEQLKPWREQIPHGGILSHRGKFLSDEELPGSDETGPPGACLLIFSSGSTGRPKAIAHSSQTLLTSAAATLDFYGAKPGESWLLSLDIAHIGGFQIILRCLLGGLTCVSGFGSQEISEALRAFPCLNYLSLVPTQLQRLLDRGETLPQELRAVLLGGAATPTTLIEQAKSLSWPISVTYGSTETASQVSATRVGDYPLSAGDVGELLPIWKADLGVDHFVLSGPSSCLGWWQEGVFYPSRQDTVSMSDRAQIEDGRLVIEGRRDDVFQIAGENCAPREILDALTSLANKGDWTLVPLPDKEYGTIPILIYRGLQNPPTQTQVENQLQQTLSRLKWPRACYWHRSSDLMKPSLTFYREALANKQLEHLWTRN